MMNDICGQIKLPFQGAILAGNHFPEALPRAIKLYNKLIDNNQLTRPERATNFNPGQHPGIKKDTI